MGTNTGTIMTLANSIIGVSVLAMPFCFKQCGIALSILMLIASSLLSRLACHLLLKSAVMARRRTFEFLAFHTFGLTGKFAVELFIIGFLMGTCIAFFVVMGDLGPAIVANILGLSNKMSLRPSVLIGLAIFVVLPLGMLKNVDSLSSVSMATIGFYICLVLKVVGESLPHLLAGDWFEQVNFWRPAGILQCIPIFSMALFCQTQLFEIYESMNNASLDRMNFVIRAACNICTGVYICVGFFGYIAFCSQPFTGNVLMSFTPSIVSEMIKLGFVLSVAVSFPLAIFPCRASLYSLLFRRISMPHHENVGTHIPEARFKCLTVFIISVALVIGLLIPNIELVLGLVGSTIGVLICVMFPAAAFICMSTKNSGDRFLAQVLLFVGALILVLGTYATLNSTSEIKLPEKVVNKPSELVPDKQSGSIEFPANLEEKVISKDEMINGGSPKQSNLGVETNVIPGKHKESEMQVNLADKRQEPPVPVEPAGDQLRPQPSILPFPKQEKIIIKEEIEKDKSRKEKEKHVSKEETDGKMEKQSPNAESVNKEGKSTIIEQVDQEAIKKEDEELAEAEKGRIDVGNSKNDEIFRKLEKHEAQHKELIEEQKKILHALQEYHEKEMLKEKKESADRTLSEIKIAASPKEIKDESSQNINQNNEEVKQLNEEVKKSKMNVIGQTQPKKQDLLQKIASGELGKPPENIIAFNHGDKQPENIKLEKVGYSFKNLEIKEKSELKEARKLERNSTNQVIIDSNKQTVVAEIIKPILNENSPSKAAFVTVDKKEEILGRAKEFKHEVNIPLADIAVSNKKAENSVDISPAAPVQPVLLDLKNPLPLALQQRAKSSANLKERQPAMDSNVQSVESGINTIRRDILQDSAPSTEVSLTREMLNASLHVKQDLNTSARDFRPELHEREKRDIEEEKINETHVQDSDRQRNKGKVTQSPLLENCDATKKIGAVESIPNKETVKNPNKIPSEDLNVATGILQGLAIVNALPNANSTETKESALKNEPLKESLHLQSDVHQGVDKIIKSIPHLSDPHIKSKAATDISMLNERDVSPEAKPMKRDLKSVLVSEEQLSSRK